MATQKKATARVLGSYASLTSRATTDNAKALLDALTPIVAKQELDSGDRKNRRGEKATTELRRALEAFVGDLLGALASEKAEGIVYRSMDSGAFTGAPVSYRMFSSMVGALQGLGLIEHTRGQKYWAKVPFDENAAPQAYDGRASRFKATSLLTDLCVRYGVPPEEAKDHFSVGLPESPLILKASSTRRRGRKVSGGKMRYKPSDHTRALEADIKKLNAFLDTHELRGGAHRGYTRIFNEGDTKAFDWNKGGRLYSQGDGSYQRDKKDVRLRMTIDGEPVVEIDIRASYLTMLHGLQGVPFDTSSDPYDLKGIERDLVKLWMVATLGNPGHLTRWPRGLSDDYLKETGKRPGSVASAMEIRKRMIAKHSTLDLWDAQTITWADLMFHESEAMLDTMLELMDKEIPSLCVHDSLIVRETDAAMAESFLKANYGRRAGITPALTVTRAA